MVMETRFNPDTHFFCTECMKLKTVDKRKIIQHIGIGVCRECGNDYINRLYAMAIRSLKDKENG